jgi:hypothetical protein
MPHDRLLLIDYQPRALSLHIDPFRPCSERMTSGATFAIAIAITEKEAIP